MRKNYTGQRAHVTGDVNLAAACMSMGVPLDPHQPVTVTLQEGRPDYGSFHLMPETVDGSTLTAELMGAWNAPEGCKNEMFSSLMRFIRERPQGVRTSADWLDHAHDWLRLNRLDRVAMPRRLEDVPAYLERHADSVAGHILAFAFNRETCFQEYNAAKPEIFMEAGSSVVRVSTALDKKTSRELLARLQG